MKWGTGFKYGTSWKYGHGTSEPWIPSAGAARFTIESLTDSAADTIRDFSSLLFIDNLGVLRAKYGSYPNQVFYLISPNLTSWRVTVNGSTGLITVQDGFTGTPVGLELVDNAGVIWKASISNLGIISLTTQFGFTIEGSAIPTYTPEVP